MLFHQTYISLVIDSYLMAFQGKRVCLGEQLAKKELFIFFTSMVQNFRFTMEDEKNPPSLKGVDGPIHGPGNYNLRALRV